MSCKAWKNKDGLWLLPERVSHSPRWTLFEFTEDINQAWVGRRPPFGMKEEVWGHEVRVKRTVKLGVLQISSGDMKTSTAP
jgi:hypothetical protein